MYSIGLGFTSNCNMNCPFCYSRNKRNNRSDLSIRKWIEFINLNHVQIKDINYGTGENTTSDEWYQFIAYVRRHYPKIKQALTTNGSLAYIISSNSEKESIITNCIDEIDVSLDFGDSDIHNYYRGNKNAFTWALRTLEYCQNTKKDSTIVMLGIDDTLEIDNLESIFKIAKCYNAKVRINLYRPVDSTSNIKPASYSKIMELFHWVNLHHEFLSISDPLFSSMFFPNNTKKDPSGISSIRILQNGDIFPSTYLLTPELKMGNILNFDLSTIKTNSIYSLISDLSLPIFCSDCAIKNTCRGGALDRRYLWYGSFAECDPYCPCKNGVQKEDISILEKYSISQKEFHSVHDGYLPTLFFGY